MCPQSHRTPRVQIQVGYICTGTWEMVLGDTIHNKGYKDEWTVYTNLGREVKYR